MRVRERWRERNVKPKRKAADDHKFYLATLARLARGAPDQQIFGRAACSTSPRRMGAAQL